MTEQQKFQFRQILDKKKAATVKRFPVAVFRAVFLMGYGEGVMETLHPELGDVRGEIIEVMSQILKDATEQRN